MRPWKIIRFYLCKSFQSYSSTSKLIPWFSTTVLPGRDVLEPPESSINSLPLLLIAKYFHISSFVPQAGNSRIVAKYRKRKQLLELFLVVEEKVMSYRRTEKYSKKLKETVARSELIAESEVPFG
jgi:hypothetical protein